MVDPPVPLLNLPVLGVGAISNFQVNLDPKTPHYVLAVEFSLRAAALNGHKTCRHSYEGAFWGAPQGCGFPWPGNSQRRPRLRKC